MKILKTCASLIHRSKSHRGFRQDENSITRLDLLLRALASPTRLAILSLLFRSPEDLFCEGPAPIRPETRPGSMARSLGLHPTTLSHHLRALLRLRLVRYHKKGREKFYAMARVREGTLRSFLLLRIADELTGKPARPPVHRPLRGARRTRPPRHADIASGRLGPLWSALTSFSHFRRMLMLRELARPAGATLEDLSRAADLAPSTVAYHLDKLMRRGVVATTRSRGGRTHFGLRLNSPTTIQAVGTVFAALALGAIRGPRRCPPLE